MRNIAVCRSRKILSVLPTNSKIYYIRTQFKTLTLGEWSKFVFAAFVNDTNINRKKKFTFIRYFFMVVYYSFKKKKQKFLILFFYNFFLIFLDRLFIMNNFS